MKILTKLKFISTFFFSFLIIYLSFIYAAPTIEANNPIYMQTTTTVNFRSLASTSSKIVKKLNTGTVLKVVGSIDNYYIVQLSTNEVGLVHKDYTKSSSSKPNRSFNLYQSWKENRIYKYKRRKL